jgi:TPP-dependent pyruvate/acetoin dehydrogenase alpha subunit
MPREELIRLFRQMYRIRRVEEVIADLYPQQQMRCPVHLCIGQEATPVGVCAELRPEDYAFSTHRSHGHYLAKGGSLAALLGELYGRAIGCALGKGGSMHLIDLPSGFLGAAPILGATIALAVGAALGTKMRGEPRITVAFFGDAAVEEGVFYESASFAALHRLPVLLVCENNQLSTTTPLSERQPAARKICELARAIGLTSAEGDGNDVLEVRRLTRRVLDLARRGGGPAFLELHTYRLREHCGPAYDYDLGYRSREEVERWQQRCPLRRLHQYMVDRGQWDSAAMERLRGDVEREIEEAVRLVQASPYPAAPLLLEHEYAPSPPPRDRADGLTRAA